MNMLRILFILIFAASSMTISANEKQSVQDVVTVMVNSIDKKEWDLARAKFTPDVFVDYSSMNNIAGAEAKSADLVDGWQQLLQQASTHHMLSNFQTRIDGETALVETYVYASHLAEGIDYWDIFGRYVFGLKKTTTGWKINAMTLIVHGQKGNVNFLSQLQDGDQ